jgi:hypothetical protein
LIFDNSVEEHLVENDHFASLTVEQNGHGIQILNEFLQEEIQFKGSENFLIFSRTYKMDLVCEFEEHIYPFDVQTCSIKVRTKIPNFVKRKTLNVGINNVIIWLLCSN